MTKYLYFRGKRRSFHDQIFTVMKKIIFLCVLIFSFVACSGDDDGCRNKILPNTNLESEYGCTNTKYSLDIDLKNDNTIIRNQASFNELVMGSCHPLIDFVTYDLIIGKKGLNSGNDTIEYKLIQNCKTSNLELTVSFYQNRLTAAPNVTYHALIPKITGQQKIDVEIEMLY